MSSAETQWRNGAVGSASYSERLEMATAGLMAMPVANNGPEDLAVYAAMVEAMTKIFNRDGVACPAAAVVETLAALVAVRAANRDEIEAHAEIVVDLENIAAKWRGKVR